MTTTPKITSEFILLIMNCQKYRYKAEMQQNTWLTNFALMPYFHVIGNIDLKNEYQFDNDAKILYVKTNDDYNSLPKKVIASYFAIQQEYNYKYIFKTDDDQMVENCSIFNTIQQILIYNNTRTNKIHYGGQLVNVTTPHFSQYHKIHPELPPNLPILKTKYCSGRFYLLSNVAVKQLLIHTDLICKEYFEDYAIGFYLNNSLKTNMLCIETNTYFTDII